MSDRTMIEHKTMLPITRAIKRHLPNFDPRTIFDIGANVGQSAVTFSSDYPAARIYSFEPVKATFRMAQENCKHLENTMLYNLGFGRASGEVLMTNSPGSVANHIVSDSEKRETEKVRIVTGDEFCLENDIMTIDYLKIDTEGLDLDVLIGFVTMLSRHAIALVEVEVGMNPANNRHVPFEKIKNFLEPLEYYLFFITEQTHDVKFSGRPVLRRSNMVFISDTTVSGNNVKSAAR